MNKKLQLIVYQLSKFKFFNPKIIINMFINIIIITTIFSINSSANEDRNYLIFAGGTTSPPFEFLDESGNYVGFNVDLIHAISNELGREIRLIPRDWLGTYESLQNGEIDAIQGMNFNAQRKEIYDFSSAYLLNSSICFVNQYNNEIKDFEDLKGHIVAVERNGYAAYILAEMGEIEVMFMSDMEDAFERLLKGEIDAVFCNKLTGVYILRDRGWESRIHTIGNEINQVDYGIAVKKGNILLLSEINVALEKIKGDGTYNKIYEKWFGLEDSLWSLLKKYAYLVGIIITVFFVTIALITKWNRTLKREVDRQTKELRGANQALAEHKETIEESNHFKLQIIDSLQIGLITFDSEKKLTTLNRFAENLFEFNREEAIGSTFEEIGLDQYFKVDLIDRCIANAEAIVIHETIFHLPQGEKYYNCLLSPLVEGISNCTGGVMTFKCIDEDKRIRLELAQKDKMSSLGTLISGIAHEIRNPLSTINTYIELLPVKYDNEKFRNKIISQLPNEINRLDEMLTDLLNYAKPKKSDFQLFYIEELLTEVIDLFEPILSSKNITIETSIKNKVELYADRNKIKQIFINLILNSVDAVDEKGHIKISITELVNSIIIEFIDNGCGINSENLSRVFDPFFTTKQKGTGLGLATCYQYINEHKGKMKIDSKIDNGTIVKLILPKGCEHNE
ncbi:transporter substrate-binding domain-containing protein [Acidaminobacter hydrogenoformans]|uniref:histidine kinase n=1 Tax=Acidaminobacter hydrogenoformans DSM 2784 TaxID=1120920 RepID=A0A1G5S8M5_9FIRM|nr:transporter substrate-binding domain-containing protein [Acidaminobacter hydrogenoformans]SCZ82061.1 polar amino acid transport system substrate-binding protein [Acidaminobacter hydrogenoformans DSM 2784]